MGDVQRALYAAADSVPLWGTPVVVVLVGAVIMFALLAYEMYNRD